MNSIELKKNHFLDKYNPRRSVDVALNKAINAAVQHNLLYSRTATTQDRERIRFFWKQRLKEIGSEFNSDVEVKRYESLISNLALLMNQTFGDLFDNTSKHGSVFRVSHSQKSIAVFVKHLWCMNLISEPKICPVDRIILSESEAKKNNDLSWGCVNSLEEHRRKFQYLQNAADQENMTLAKWELMKFKSI